MAKKIIKQLKLQIAGGQAVPGQQLGPALGQAGVNIGEFVTKFNDATKERRGEIVPVVLTVFEDRTYEMTYKTSPASNMLLKAIGQEKGSGKNTATKIGTVSKSQVREIAEKKMEDLNAASVEAAMRIIEGTARSMGIEVK
jgi:large subunit ribosomal protein L11